MKELWSKISKTDVIKAIKLLDKTKEKYPEPRNTFLIYKNKKYPAKHIRGLAYFLANKREISKNDYNGGEETAIFFSKLGFMVEYKKVKFNPKKNIDVSADKMRERDNKNILEKKRKLDVVIQKNALQLLVQKNIGYIECEKKFDWLRTPEKNILPKEYKPIVTALIKYRNQPKFLISNRQLLCDLVIEERKIIIEYDEYQHFSEARKISLEHYPNNIKLGFSRNEWIKACEKLNRKDNNPIYRDEGRAYLDTVRDIEAFKHGYKLIRLKHGEIDWEAPEAQKDLLKLISLIK
jgi:hypothetical protein